MTTDESTCGYHHTEQESAPNVGGDVLTPAEASKRWNTSFGTTIDNPYSGTTSVTFNTSGASDVLGYVCFRRD